VPVNLKGDNERALEEDAATNEINFCCGDAEENFEARKDVNRLFGGAHLYCKTK